MRNKISALGVNKNILLKDYETKFSSNRKKKKDEIYFWVNSTYSFLLVFIISLFIYYIWILNINATQWYNIRTLEMERQNLLLQKELLDVKISNLESLKNIKGSNELDSIIEKVEDPDFVVIRNWVIYAYKN